MSPLCSVIKDLIAEANATKQAIDEAYEGIESANEAAHAAPPAPPAAAEADFFGGWGDGSPAPLPASTKSAQPPAPPQEQSEPEKSASFESNETPSYSYIPPPAPAPAGPGMFDGGGYNPGHERNVSNMSGFGEVMGTGPGLGDLQTVGEASSAYGGEIPSSPSMAEVELMKSKSKEADDVAKDAEESRRQLAAQLEEMRRLADEAEIKSREASAKPVKKKGFMKRGGKQQQKDAVSLSSPLLVRFTLAFVLSLSFVFLFDVLQQEIERLALDARDKKEKLMQVQAQVKDAEALSEQTKKEAERLNKEAEDAQMQAAAAASMQHQKPPAPAPQQQLVPSSNGYPPHSYGMPPHSSNGGYGMPPPTNDGGFGGPPLGSGGYDTKVMSGGGGGAGIPTPANGADDPYSNPFGE